MCTIIFAAGATLADIEATSVPIWMPMDVTVLTAELVVSKAGQAVCVNHCMLLIMNRSEVTFVYRKQCLQALQEGCLQ